MYSCISVSRRVACCSSCWIELHCSIANNGGEGVGGGAELLSVCCDAADTALDDADDIDIVDVLYLPLQLLMS